METEGKRERERALLYGGFPKCLQWMGCFGARDRVRSQDNNPGLPGTGRNPVTRVSTLSCWVRISRKLERGARADIRTSGALMWDMSALTSV